MTFFQIADEYERDFEPLEQDDFEGCVYASALFVQMGHMCARQMTDGRMTPAMLKKRLSLWPDDRREQAIAHLVELGQWRQTETGYEFVDWDLTQYTKAQETRRRALAAERQRQRRRRLAEAALPNEVSGVHQLPLAEVASRVTEPASRSASRSRAEKPAKPRAKPLAKTKMSRVTSRSPLPLSDLKETSSLGSAAPAAPLPAVANLAEAAEKRAKRKRSPFHERRQELAALFDVLYSAKYPGCRSFPKRQDVWSTVTKAYELPGGPLNVEAARQSIQAFLAAPWWVGEGRPGHSFDGWAKHHERYDSVHRATVAADYAREVLPYVS